MNNQNVVNQNELLTESPTHQQVSDAIQWLVQFEAGNMNECEQRDFKQWLDSCQQHQLAWQRLSNANQYFSFSSLTQGESGLSASLALNSIQQSDIALSQKRHSLKVITGMAGLGILSWQTRDMTGLSSACDDGYHYFTADLRTEVGEQRKETLADGTQLILNTQSAVDVDMQARPQINLFYGEISLALTHALQPLQIRVGGHLFIAEANSVIALTSLSDTRRGCQLQVLSGIVSCLPAKGSLIKVSSGQGLWLEENRTDTGPQTEPKIAPLQHHALSWREGFLSAERRQLGDFIQQLDRYRSGYLSCSNEVAKLTLSGSFPISNTDLILDNLCQILPIRQQRISRYWVRLLPA